jgi:hypothetical protein
MSTEISAISGSVFCDIMLRSMLKFNGRFGGFRCLHLQGLRKVKQKKQAPCWFLAWLILRLWRWKRHVLPARRFTSSRLHEIISQKIELFTTISVRTSSPTWFYCRSREIDSCNYNSDVSAIWHSFPQNIRQWFPIILPSIDTNSSDFQIERTRYEHFCSVTYKCFMFQLCTGDLNRVSCHIYHTDVRFQITYRLFKCRHSYYSIVPNMKLVFYS